MALFSGISAGCNSDLECPLTQACISRACQNPCLYEQCGREAVCEPQNHKARCVCPPGYLGDPYTACRRPECTVDDDCPQVLACQNEKCVDPCACSPLNANCIVRAHRARCQCNAGYQGDPYNAGCVPSMNHQPLLLPIKFFFVTIIGSQLSRDTEGFFVKKIKVCFL